MAITDAVYASQRYVTVDIAIWFGD